jgi:flagellar hook-associated protein 2
MAGVSLSGMASGLDTSSIISQLMQLEQNKVTQVQMKQVGVQAHKDNLSTIKGRLDNFKAAAAALGDAATWKTSQTTTSSDTSKLDVTLLGGSGIGGHTVEIQKLASSAQHGFAYTPSTSATSLDLYYGTDPNAAGASKVTVAVAANATAADVATAINANEAAPVFAAVVKDAANNERIVLSARKTGASSDFSVSGAALAEDTAYARTGTALNASYVLDGEAAPRTSESNIVDNAIAGVRLTLKGVTSSAATVTTSAAAIDTAAIQKKVQNLVDSYNAVVTEARSDLTEKNDPKSTTTSGLQKGRLFGDTGLSSMLGQLKDQMRQTVTGLGLGSLADLGITVPKATGGASTQDARDGKLSFDSSVLTTALASDWTKVRDLFTGKGTTKGIAAKLTDYVATQTGTNGIITGRMSSDDSILKDYTTQITKLNDRMTTTEARLKAQFAAMETALNSSQTQQAWLSGQIASLPGAA